MKCFYIVAAIALLWCGTCVAQFGSTGGKDSNSEHPSASTSSSTTKIDPVKEADIRKLLEVAGTKSTMTQMMVEMESNLKPMLAAYFPPGEYRDQLIELFIKKFHSKADPQQMVDLAVPVYDKYLSEEDIRGLIQFYSTPLGQKAITVLPKLMIECGEAGRKWGEDLGRESMQEVLTEHPDLEKAMKGGG